MASYPGKRDGNAMPHTCPQEIMETNGGILHGPELEYGLTDT